MKSKKKIIAATPAAIKSFFNKELRNTKNNTITNASNPSLYLLCP